MKFCLRQYNKKNSGFTLVETLVSIAIFSTSIIGLMSILGQGISDTNYAKQKIVVSYLAQEGIEQMRNMRDTYVLYTLTTGKDWNSFGSAINSCGNPGEGNNKSCYVNDAGGIQSCGNDLCTTPLKYDSNTGKYNYTFGTDTNFIRSIQARYPNGPNGEIKISSIVSWTQGSGNYNITFSETLYNWTD